ncbi:MAG: sulfatase-like hydrolase/transferase [Bryobacteraceae bacterium]|nr:sulfatase-like hydrolase/transferase [Bryobacteraceae bacterium]
MMTRRSFNASVAPAILKQPRGSKQPNLLFLMADDHAGYVLGGDGNKRARTPNMDRLAAEGVRFASHYCNSPVCTPSRQSLLTGQMPHMAGVTQLRTALSTEKPTLAKMLKIAGYTTATFGKMHFNQPGKPGLHGFDICQTEDVMQRRWATEVKAGDQPAGVNTKPLPWRPFQTPAKQWLNADCLPFPRSDAQMKGTFIARQAEAYLEEHRGKPFALWTSFHEPHSPFDFPIEDRAAFDPAGFDDFSVGPQDGGQIPLIFRDLPPAAKRGIAAAYYTAVHFLDRNIGRVLAKLKQLDLDRDTLVVYTADHGYMLGQHGRFEKHCGYDPALRVPLIMRLPGRIRPRVVRDFTEHLDLAPAVIDLLGLARLPVEHGQSLLPYAEGRGPQQVRSHIVSEYLENEEVFVRDARWKYIYCSGRRKREDGYLTADPTPGRYERLFDLEHDSGEFTDVAAKHPDVVKKMKEIALRRFRETHMEAQSEPKGKSTDDSLDFYLRPRDNAPPAESRP